MWHLFLFNDLLLWTRPPAQSSSTSSSSAIRSPTASPRLPRSNWTSLFGSSENTLPRSASSSSTSSTEGKFNVEMIDDLVHLSASEVPVSHTHPDAEVRGPSTEVLALSI